MKIILIGALGRMGTHIDRLATDEGHTVIARVDPGFASAAAADHAPADGSAVSVARAAEVPESVAKEAEVLVDFSHHSATEEVLALARRGNIPTVIGVTGHSEDERRMIEAAGETLPVFRSANMSVGVAVLERLVREATRQLRDYDIEIVEAHHRQKADSPSGTALMLANAIRDIRPELTIRCGRSGTSPRDAHELGIQALRYGQEPGRHEVIFGGPYDTIRLTHEARDRTLFAAGALRAAAFIVKQEPGLYTMDDLVGA